MAITPPHASTERARSRRRRRRHAVVAAGAAAALTAGLTGGAAAATASASTSGGVPAAAATSTAATPADTTAATSTDTVTRGSVVFPGNDGRTHEVGFDEHSFTVDGERLNVWSGEFHYWRLPSPEHWRDLLQKIRANGFNAVSLYFFWGYHQTTPGGEFDFSGVKDIDRLLTMAAEEGLYVIARPGPYVNAEISMGGLPAYMANREGGLRTSDPENLQDSLAWIDAFDEIVADHQITTGDGGPVILYQVENEMLSESPARVEFMRDLVEQVESDGITVPLFHNDYGMGGRFAPGSGRPAGDIGLDFYAYDNYPLGFNCSADRRQLADFEEGLRSITTDGPNFISEAQGGAFSPWGASFGFDECYDFTDPAFLRQYGVNNVANGVTAFNYYMAFGGTNWGWTGSPSSGYTSYDYGAAITEDRALTEKFTTQRELGYFIESVPQLTSMSPLEAPPVTVAEGASVNGYERIATEDADTSVTGNGTRFLGYRLTDSNDTTDTTFTTSLTLGPEDPTGASRDITLNDDDPSIAYTGDGWTHSTGEPWTAEDLNGDETWSKQTGDAVELTFTGSGIKVITPRANNHGYGDVFLDGEKVGEINSCLASETYVNEYQHVAFSADDLDPRQEHTLRVVVRGEDGCPDGNVEPGPTVSIDAFAVTPPLYTTDDTQTGAVTYTGAWESADGAEQAWARGNYLDTETFSDTAGDYAEYTFTGTGIQVIAPQSGNHGYAEVSIDGQPAGRFTTYNGPQNASKRYVAFEARDLADGEHTIRVTVTGEKPDGSAGTFVSLDAFNVLTAADEPTTPPEEPAGPTFDRIPQKDGTFLRLHGRDALALVADYRVGEHEMYYTTSQLVGNVPTREGRLLTLSGYPGDAGETVLRYDAEPRVTTLSGADPEVTWDGTTGTLRLNYTHGPALFEVSADGTAQPLLVRVTDRDEMSGLWRVDGAKDGGEGGGNAAVQVFGAHLVRTVRYADGVAHLTGSMTDAGRLTVHVPPGIESVTWNGEPLGGVTEAPGGAISGDVPGPEPVVTPELTTWRTAQGSPESAVEFDDSGWVVADATTADNPRQGPGPDTGVVLDSNFYRFFEGDVWYRAHYTAGEGDTITLNGNGGTGGPGHGKNSASMLVWVNGKYAGAAMAEGRAKTFQIPAGATTPGEPVVLSVLVRNQGQNLDWSDNGLSKQNRGLWNARLNNDGAVTWRIQGARDRDDPEDSARTLYNNGGLYGERAGWHLPGYPDDTWEQATTMHAERPGVAWYRTSFDLDVPAGQDTRFALQVHSDDFAQLADRSRTVMFVNGWNVGTWVGYVGPQSKFTIPSGFLDMNGENEIAIAVTAEEAGAGPDSVELVQVGNVTGGMPNVQNTAPDWHEIGGDPTGSLDVRADSRCLAGTAHVAVRARNTGAEPADVVLRTPFGERTVADVAPGDSAYQAFSTRRATVDAGAAGAAVAGTTAAVEAPYPAADCG